MRVVAVLAGIPAVIAAISWADDLLDRRKQARAARAVVAAAEHLTRTAATNSRTDKDQT